jgi:hypothetical protein
MHFAVVELKMGLGIFKVLPIFRGKFVFWLGEFNKGVEEFYFKVPIAKLVLNFFIMMFILV